MTFSLSYVGFTSSYIQSEYAAITGYVLPIILLPGFFTGAISSAILPGMSRDFSNNKKHQLKKKLRLGCILSLLVGIPFTIILLLFSDNLLQLFYHTTIGSNYLKILAPFFILYYLESPFSSCLQAMNKSKRIMIDNFYGALLKNISILILPFLNLGIYSIIIGNILNVSIITIRHFNEIKRTLKI